jgi:hypothetical protein
MLIGVLITIGTIVLIVAATAMIAPFSLHMRCRFVQGSNTALVRACWLHPAVFLATYDILRRELVVRVLGRRRKASDDAEPAPPPAPIVPASNGGAPGSGASGGTRSGTPDLDKREPSPAPAAPSASRSAPGPAMEPHRRAFDPPGRLRSFWNSLRANRVLFVLRQTDFRRAALRWAMRGIARFFGILKLDECSFRITGNLENPAVTGKVYGYIEALRHALVSRARRRLEIIFTPVFDRDILEVEGDVRLRTSAARLLSPMAAAACTFPYWSAFRVWRRTVRFSRQHGAAGTETHV